MKQALTYRFKKTSFMLVLAVGLLMPLLVTSTASAALFNAAKNEACEAVGGNCGPNAGADKLSNTITNVINLITAIVGIICVIMIIVSGIRFIVSNGDSNQVTSARNTLIYALVGLVLVALAQFIVKVVLARINI